MKCDDDTYVIVENLRHFLSNRSADEPVYIGSEFKDHEIQGGKMLGNKNEPFHTKPLHLCILFNKTNKHGSQFRQIYSEDELHRKGINFMINLSNDWINTIGDWVNFNFLQWT